MFEILTVVIFGWLLVKVAKLAFKLTWGLAKVSAGILMAVAMPLLFLCVLFASGMILLIPLALLAIAFGIVKSCN